jgi:uncharacterized membrane protein YbaN (DUF454 family)
MPTLQTRRWPDTLYPATDLVAGRFCSETMTQPARSKLARLLYGILAYVSLGIGLVAIVIPGLPTTEFILLAAWAATRSSPRLSAWLENHRLFGPILYNWRNGKVIQRRAKISATISMLLCAGVMLTFLEHHWPVFLAIAGMTLGNLWIWSRPERATPPATSCNAR